MSSNLIESGVEKSTRRRFVSLSREYLVTPSTDNSNPKLVATTTPEKTNIKTLNDVVAPTNPSASLNKMTTHTSKSKDSLKRDQNSLDYDRLTYTIEGIPAAQFLMNRFPESNTISYFTSKAEVVSKSYQEQVAKAYVLEPTKRILRFTSSATSLRHVDLRKTTPKPQLTTRISALPIRYILSSPEKGIASCFES
ncbi:hypothetical protein BD770DRAFT_444580 [Pilaira anomala]|nr:hypothetical protein BD770DRAFT_444580 [Pilaira anomala]